MSLLTMAPPMLSDIPSPTSSHNSSSPSTSSLLFGFLISFVALFTIFIGCGLGSRYMVDRRRQRHVSESDPLRAGRRRSRKPALWDVGAIPGKEKWEDMMPLSVELLRTSTSPSPSPPPRHREYSFAEQVLHLAQGFGRGGGLPFASPLPRPSSPVSATQDSGPTDSDGPADLQIAVLIVMPTSASLPRDMSERNSPLNGQETNHDNVDMSNFALGITAIPWDKERMDFG